MDNSTIPLSEFLLHCVVESDKRNLTVCLLFFIYFVSLFGNLLVTMVIIFNHQLHTPMYIYIATLAVIDLANSTNLIPKMLNVLMHDSSAVPYGSCLLQMYVVLYLEAFESLLLAQMAFDRYVAVVHPLRYPSIITKRNVLAALLISNIVGAFAKSPFIFLANELPFCHSNVLPYCFCDYATMVHVACTENPKYLIILSGIVTFCGVFPLLLILFSYARISLAALKISSVEGKKKVFSTCLTHLLVVGLFYFPLLASYILPGTGVQLSTEAYNTMVIVGNVVPPMLNPVIYSFRNKKIKNNIVKLLTLKRITPANTDH
ncbi:olfactory receptor 1468-like [Erpetoichthys calabaricus]|uniref:olfactory receptor 1468-like n=1 Tax=Erpetoichthys calabaricus TaxID=27687 RepID=UPI002234C65A|nr:olfactory receptor 1468-like [Erpetoichthys calabaricus]